MKRREREQRRASDRVRRHFVLLPADMTMNPSPLWKCRYCSGTFPTTDRTGRANVLGLISHLAMHLRQDARR